VAPAGAVPSQATGCAAPAPRREPCPGPPTSRQPVPKALARQRLPRHFHHRQIWGNIWSICDLREHLGARPCRGLPAGVPAGGQRRAALGAGGAAAVSGVRHPAGRQRGGVFGLSVCGTSAALSLARPDLRRETGTHGRDRAQQRRGIPFVLWRSFPLSFWHPQHPLAGAQPPPRWEPAPRSFDDGSRLV